MAAEGCCTAAAGGGGAGRAFPADVLIVPSSAPPAIDMTLHADNRARLVAAMRGADVPEHAVIVLQGGEAETRHETDHEHLFRQESHFHWAFGVREPDCYGVIELDTGRAVLYIPRLPEAYAVWMGEIKTPAQWAAEYGVEEVRYTDELADTLAAAKASVLYVLHGFNSDGKRYAKPASFPGMERFRVDNGRLWPAVTELRVLKTEKEIALLRHAAIVSSEAHMAVMQHVKPGQHEYQLESLFQHWCYYHGGCRHMSYTCICATGKNGAVLHYGHAGEPNAKVVRAGDMCLFDMGSEYHCYGSDITVSYPATGKFSDDQRIIYTAVLSAVRAVEDAMRPGVNWRDMHALAYRTILTHLRDAGILAGDVEAMMAPEVNLGAIFMPHGLGHFLGIDTHDVGGYPAGVERPKAAGFASLRTARDLEAGMYITVEPGCYFIDPLLDAALADPKKAAFIVPEALARFRGFGGVRIEDDVLVTADGCENFTWAPRSIEDIEGVMAGTITRREQITKYH